MKILFITLEESAKQNLSSILEHSFLKENYTNVFTFGMSEMKLSYNDLTNMPLKSIMGFTKILTNLFYIYKLRSKLHEIISSYNFTHIFFIDSFDFTRFYLKRYKNNHIRYCQIIGPSVFLWNKKKANFINENLDHIFSIFDVEKKYYLSEKYSYIGHPLFDRVNIRKHKDFNISNIGFFLGSRDQEITVNLPIIKDLIIKLNKHYALNFFLYTTPSYYQFLIEEFSNFKSTRIILNDDNYYKSLSKLDFAFACSGTVHLELSFSHIPHFIFYKTSIINYLFVKFFIKIRFISLINIFNQKEIVHEFIQQKFTVNNLYKAFYNFKNNEKIYSRYIKELKSYLMKSNFKKLNQNLIIDYLKKSS